MTLDEIETAVGQHLAGLDDVPTIVWPNLRKGGEDNPPTRPYLEFRHSPGVAEDITITGDSPVRHRGIFLISVVTDLGQTTGAANGLAQLILGGFPKGLRLTAGDGFVLIENTPNASAGFRDGVNWRMPITVRYRTAG